MKKIISTSHNKVIELIDNGALPEIFLNDNYESIIKKHKTQFSSLKFLVDRTGTIPHYLNVNHSLYPIPVENHNLSFAEVAKKRALELINLGKPIYVSWSGGIDSTFALLTLYHYANDKSQIRVYGTYNSVIESGYVFDKFIKDKFIYDIHTPVSKHNNYKNIEPGSIVVTGSLGNNIFYQDLNWHQPDSWMLFKDPIENPIQKFAEYPYQDVLQEPNIEFLQECILKSPRKIETLQDLRWWIQFNFNWYTVKTTPYIGLGQVNNIHSFFDSEEFQSWSIFNNDPPTKTGDYTDERWQQREIVAEYLGETDYSKNKKNTTSVLSSFGKDWLFLLDDYSNVYLDDLQSPTSVSYK
jgi:hypothetical protein